MKNPKQNPFALAAVVAIFSMVNPLSVRADDKHDHKDHEHVEKKAGPNGGRLITTVEPHLELLVTGDRKVQITAVDDHNKPIALKKQSVKIYSGDRSNPTKMKFVKQGNILISDVAFPEGKRVPVVVQIKVSATSKKVIEKFNLNLAECPTCKYKEYACVCDHEHEDHDQKEKD